MAATTEQPATETVETVNQEETKEAAKEESPNTINLHSYPRSSFKYVLPSPSPFALKLETWLRLKQIPYKLVETSNGSKKTGLIPYIHYKGEEISDSNLVIQNLSREMSLDITEGMSGEEQATARAFQKMVDEHTVWCFAFYRFNDGLEHTKKLLSLPGPKFLHGLSLKMLCRNSRQRLHGQGLGRRTPEEIYQIGKEDMKAISSFLGSKPFLMGDKMSAVDCSVFGLLCQIVFVDHPSPYKEYIDSDLANIKPYLERIRDLCWPDWVEICTPPKEEEHPKKSKGGNDSKKNGETKEEKKEEKKEENSEKCTEITEAKAEEPEQINGEK